MSNIDTQQLKNLIEATDSVTHEELGETNLFDNALIIFESGSTGNAQDIQKLLSDGKANIIEITSPYDYQTFANKIVEVNREGQWLIVDVKTDIHPNVISVLKSVAEENVVRINNYEDQDIFEMKLNNETRIIFCIKRDLLEKTISYPYFLNLFGPVISVA